MYIGIDLGGTNLAVGLVDAQCHLVAKKSAPTGREREFSEIMAEAASLIGQLLQENGVDIGQLKAIGMGTPGLLDFNNKTILRTSNFPKIKNHNVEAELQKYFPTVPVYVENDANAAAYGEALEGAAKGISNVVVVTLGTGVGGGVIIDGKIYAGFNHAGSELGHMILNFEGPQCGCGRHGCFETYASATALIRQTAETILEYPDSVIHNMIGYDPQNITGKTAFDAAKQGDAAGEKIVSRYVEYLAMGIVNIMNIFQPEVIVIGGGICKEGEYLLSRLENYEHIKHYSYRPPEIPSTQFVTAKLGNDAGIIGAAMLWKQSE